MGHLDLAMWWAANLMLALLLFRAWRGGFIARYPYFYGYIGCVFISALLRAYLWAAHPQVYRPVYWISELISVVFGFGVTWEIYTHILAPYRGADKMARTVLGVLLAVVLGKALLSLWGDSIRRLGLTTMQLEGNVRVLQALLLLAMLGLVVQYALPMGRNVRSMLVGYGFYVGCASVTLSLHSRSGDGLGELLNLIQRVSYVATLATWCAGMWFYSRDPALDTSMECDYDRISEQTTRALGQLRNHVIHSWRP